MAMSVRIEPINRDLVLFQEELTPSRRSKHLADFAAIEIADAKQQNTRVLGRLPPFAIYVDGRRGAPLASVRPDGVIFTEFQLVHEMLEWIAEMLETHSPVKTGRYKRSHILLADGLEVDPEGRGLPDAGEWVFVNTVPYARKIERGSSSQAPDGVYQVVANLARRRFGGIARIGFSYRTVLGGQMIGGRAGNRPEHRQPAIIVRMGTRQ